MKMFKTPYEISSSSEAYSKTCSQAFTFDQIKMAIYFAFKDGANWLQKDIQNMCSEGFDGHTCTTGDCNHLNTRDCLAVSYAEGKLSSMKELQEKDEEIQKLKNIINKMTYGLIISDPMDILEEIKQGNFQITESPINVEFLDLEKIK